ncbi:hypothetical protein LCGC14_3146400, partial [marine sediment metagenome]
VMEASIHQRRFLGLRKISGMISDKTGGFVMSVTKHGRKTDVEL